MEKLKQQAKALGLSLVLEVRMIGCGPCNRLANQHKDQVKQNNDNNIHNTIYADIYGNDGYKNINGYSGPFPQVYRYSKENNWSA